MPCSDRLTPESQRTGAQAAPRRNLGVRMLPTLLGLVAVVLWGTVIPVSRHATEQLGTFTSAAVIYLASGIVGCLSLLATGRLGSILSEMSRKYLLVCGGLMVAYTVLLYVAIGFASDRQAIVAVTVANYLWPGLTLVLSVPLLGYKARAWMLAAGIAASTAGVWLAVGGGGGGSLCGPSAPVAAAGAAAIAWALYSNLSRRWGGNADSSGMPLFLLATGICLLLIRLMTKEASSWSVALALEVAYLAVFPTLLAYTFWDIAVRRGSMPLVAAASYLTPILSVWISGFYLGVSVTPVQWLAGGLVVLGAVACRLSIRQCRVSP